MKRLTAEGVRPGDLDLVVLTHGHPDHFGNQNLFSRTRQLFDVYEYLGNQFARTPLADGPFWKLTKNVEVWKTPGHTQQDISLVVRNVPDMGTVAVVGEAFPLYQLVLHRSTCESFLDSILRSCIAGDLILSEEWFTSKDQYSNIGAWDASIQQRNGNLMLCMADIIVPGHGKLFRVTPELRNRANCQQFIRP